jgi:hypothetical protein
MYAIGIALAELIRFVTMVIHPISSSDCKRELTKYPFLAALDTAVDKDWQFPDNRLPNNC